MGETMSKDRSFIFDWLVYYIHASHRKATRNWKTFCTREEADTYVDKLMKEILRWRSKNVIIFGV